MDETTQKQILDYLLAGHPLTVGMGAILFHTHDLRVYITRLRRAGIDIEDRWISQDGVRFKRYWLHPDTISKIRHEQLGS